MDRSGAHSLSVPGSSGSGFGIMGWALAVLLSLGLNLFLFGIMPGLIQQASHRPKALETVREVQVVRIKRPEAPVRKREKARPPKPEKRPKPLQELTRITAPRPAPAKPRLPFELNPALPSFSEGLKMPPLSHFSMKAAVPKGVYMASELDSPLTVLAKVPPVYPLRATRLGIEGWVKVRFTVTCKGRVEDVKILESDPPGVFENAVVRCVSQWRFRPGTVDGVGVAAQARTTIRFQLDQ